MKTALSLRPACCIIVSSRPAKVSYSIRPCLKNKMLGLEECCAIPIASVQIPTCTEHIRHATHRIPDSKEGSNRRAGDGWSLVSWGLASCRLSRRHCLQRTSVESIVGHLMPSSGLHICTCSHKCTNTHRGWAVWRTPLIPALWRQRQVDLCEFEASLIYRVSSRTAKVTQRNTFSNNKNKTNKN